MPSDVKIEDDGFAKVTLGGVTQEIDLYRTYNDLSAMLSQVREELPDDERDKVARAQLYTQRLRAYLADLKFTNRMSDRAVDQFHVMVRRAAEALGKADAVEPTPDSPGSTAPPS